MNSVAAVYAPALKWEGPQELRGNAHVKILRQDPSTGSKTYLVRLAPAANVSFDPHSSTTQHYLLSGEYESQGVVYREGTLRVIPEGSKSARITTTLGVTFLLVTEPART